MILGEDNRKAWSEMDVLIMQAYQILESERCPQCGAYKWICRNKNGKLQVRIKHDYCYAKDQIEQYEKSHKDTDSYEGPVYPEFYMLDESPLSALRASYYEDLEAEARAEAEPGDDGD